MPPARAACLAAVACLAIPASPVHAASVAILNATDQNLTFTVEHADAKTTVYRVDSGEAKAITVGREPVLRMTLNGKEAAFKLDPWTPYLFVRGKDRDIAFSGVELAGDLPAPDDVPPAPPESKPLTVKVRLYGDAADPRTAEARTKADRDRFTAAADAIAKQTGVTFSLAETAEWKSPTDVPDLLTALAAFEEQVQADPAALAVGVLGRAYKGESIGDTREPGHTHLLVRSAVPKTDAERVEALAQVLGRTLGAVRTPDTGSVMRTKLADGAAGRAGYRPQFDPLNLLVVGIWADELRAGKGPKLADLRPKARQRMLVLYKTIVTLHEQLKSEDGQAQDLADKLLVLNAADAGAKPPPVTGKEPTITTPRPVPQADGRVKAARAVVNAITEKASELSRLGNKKPKGDELTAELVKAAAEAAAGCEESARVPGFLLGLGLALDDSTILRGNPLVKPLAEAVEGNAERDERLRLLGSPTVRGRRDLCQHFAVSAALTELVGADKAELLGFAKEVADMKATSGFSFADLATDLSGVAFAVALQKDPKRLDALRKGFVIADHTAPIADLKEGLTEKAFTEQYGSPDGDKFKAAVSELRAAVKGLKVYKE